jgi:hypothetical protein
VCRDSVSDSIQACHVPGGRGGGGEEGGVGGERLITKGSGGGIGTRRRLGWIQEFTEPGSRLRV